MLREVTQKRIPINKHIEIDCLTQYRLLVSLRRLRQGYQIDPETDYAVLDGFIDHLERSRLLDGPATQLVFSSKEADTLVLGST